MLGAISTSIPCPLCEKRPVVIVACIDCWLTTNGCRQLTDEQRAKVRVFERFAPMTKGHREIFNELKRREGIKL